MEKIAVRLVNAANSVKNDDGEKFEPYKVYLVEPSDRIKRAIATRLLERVREAEGKEKAKTPTPVQAVKDEAKETKTDEKK